MRSIWPLIFVIVFGIGTILFGQKFEPSELNLFSSAVLVSTLISVIWYTVETRAYRLQQEFDGEIRNHPWLKGSSLNVDWKKDEGGLLGRDIVYLPISNVGTTPAQDLAITVAWRIEGKDRKGSNKIFASHLAPGDTHHIKLCEIDNHAPDERPALDVDISYKSFSGGGGRVRMNFFREPGKGWANGPMSGYEFWLSDGRRFPMEVGS
jgi:hypothetical protein